MITGTGFQESQNVTRPPINSGLKRRYFSRLGPREVEEVSQYKYRAIRNQMTLAHLTLSLTAVAAALVLELPDRIRRYKTFADAA